MIKPKYKLGDIVYTMCANEIVKCLVVGILLSVKNDTEKHTVNDVF